MKLHTLLATSILLCSLATTGYATVPQTVTYQGYLKDFSGTPVNSQVTLTFQLYDSPTGGTALCSESLSVTPQNGIYSAQLGLLTPLNASIFATTNLYLGIQVGSDQELVPRQQLSSVPFALRADTANMAENVNSANVILDAGQITSGTIDSARLPAVTAVGTITSGTWNGAAISPVYGGTGTNTSSATTGSLLTTTGTGIWGTLPPGNNSQVLKMTGGVPAWGTDSTGSTNGTVTSVAVSGGTTGLTTTGGPITDSGIITLGGVLGITSGGTGATNQTAAINNLLPLQSGNANKLLSTNGSTVSWVAAPGFGTGTNWAAEGTGRECTLGEIILTAGSIANGTPANGQLLNISMNTALFAVLGTRYGGNGSTTFALPDLRSVAPNNLTYSICTSGIFPSRL